VHEGNRRKRSEIVDQNLATRIICLGDGLANAGEHAQNYDVRSAKVLRQPALAGFIHSKMNDVSPELQHERLVKEVNIQLEAIEKLVSFPLGEAPSREKVKQLNGAVTQLMQEIENKTEPK
jgi:hypothetical protein